MRRATVAILCLAATSLIAAQIGAPLMIPVWTGARYVFARLGPTLMLNGNQLDVLLPPVPTPRRDLLLVHDAAAGGWPLPAGSTSVAVYVNGLRYRQGYDYVIKNGVITAQSDNMLPEFQVTCDVDGMAAQ